MENSVPNCEVDEEPEKLLGLLFVYARIFFYFFFFFLFFFFFFFFLKSVLRA